jgi:hypothetical protein
MYTFEVILIKLILMALKPHLIYAITECFNYINAVNSLILYLYDYDKMIKFHTHILYVLVQMIKEV